MVKLAGVSRVCGTHFANLRVCYGIGVGCLCRVVAHSFLLFQLFYSHSRGANNKAK